MGLFHLALAPSGDAGHIADVLAHQLGRDPHLGQRGTGHGDKGFGPSSARIVDRACHCLLARASLALDQHIDLGIGQLPDRPAQGDDGSALAAQWDRLFCLGSKRGEAPVVEDQSAFLESPPQGLDQSFGRKGLGQEVIGPALHRLDGVSDVAVSGDQHHGQVRVECGQPVGELATVHAGHAQVGDHHPLEPGAHDLECGFGRDIGRNLQTRQFQALGQGIAKRSVVLDEGDTIKDRETHDACARTIWNTVPTGDAS